MALGTSLSLTTRSGAVVGGLPTMEDVGLDRGSIYSQVSTKVFRQSIHHLHSLCHGQNFHDLCSLGLVTQILETSNVSLAVAGHFESSAQFGMCTQNQRFRIPTRI